MSNPFLTDTASATITNVDYSLFGISQPDEVAPDVKTESKNPFLTSDAVGDVQHKIFDESGFSNDGVFASGGVTSSEGALDLFCFDASAKDTRVSSDSIAFGDSFSKKNAESGDVLSSAKPGKVTISSFVRAADDTDLLSGDVCIDNVVKESEVASSSSNLRIDVSKLDFFNTKGAVSPGVSPRHSPDLENKNFEPVSDVDAMSDDSLGNPIAEVAATNIVCPHPAFGDDKIDINRRVLQSKERSNPFSSSDVDASFTVGGHDTSAILNYNVADVNAVAKNVNLMNSDIEVPCIRLTGSDDRSKRVELSESGIVLDAIVPDANLGETLSSKDCSNAVEIFASSEDFDAFAAKFQCAGTKTNETSESTSWQNQDDMFDPFGSPAVVCKPASNKPLGFDANAEFDSFLSMTKPPENTPVKELLRETAKDSFDDDERDDFSIFIRPKMKDPSAEVRKVDDAPVIIPFLPPPPKQPVHAESLPSPDSPDPTRFNPFDKSSETADSNCLADSELIPDFPIQEETKKTGDVAVVRTESQDSGTFTPLYDDDTSQPLEDFPAKFDGDGWEFMLRQPNKKKITGNRFWKKIYVRIKENTILMLYNTKDDKDPFQELPLQACYSLSEAGAQQYDAYGKIFTVKLQYVFYRERVGVRPGQISKVVQGHITSVGQLAKLGLPVEHAPQVSQLLKLGTQNYADLQSFVRCVEDSLFHLIAHRDRALQYKNEEIQVSVCDEFFAEINKDGRVMLQQARVRLFFLAFIGGMPDIEVGLNDLLREGKEVVGRHDIIPVVTEEWIRLENCDFHSCVTVDDFEKTRIVKLHPPDACLFELMRFRIRPPRNRELPLQLKVSMSISGSKVEIRGDILVPGYSSRKHGQVPCEDIKVRIPMPECWIYLFRVEKHFRYGSFKSAHRKAGKIKGLERIIGTGSSLDASLIEVSSGQAKYEHAHRAIVWRIPRLPKEGQGAYTTHLLLCRLELTSFDQIPETFEKYVDVEYVMSASTVSHTTVRSISVSQSPPEKFVRYLARYAYKVEIDHNDGKGPCEYVKATIDSNVRSEPIGEEAINKERKDSDDDFS